MVTNLQQTWNLDTIFPHGSESEEFTHHLMTLETELQKFEERIHNAQVPTSLHDLKSFASLVEQMETLHLKLRQASAYISCLTAQNVKDKKAVQLGGKVKSLHANYIASCTHLDQFIGQIEDSLWSSFLQSDALVQVAFPLDEKRRLSLEKLPPEQEALIQRLSLDGYHGWSDLYNTTVGRMTIPFEENGEQKLYSVGQAHNKLDSPITEERHRMAEAWEQAWADHADFCTEALNHLAGFRQEVYQFRNWDSIHKEPLTLNRMSEKTLQVMWEVINQNKAIFLSYFERKAQLMGLEKLGWHDLYAPISGSTTKKISYDEAAQFIIEQFEPFSPKLASFTKHVFENRWIEAEDRPGKRPGGFCTSFPQSKETRIFMTYAGTASSVATLAHELGHAYHQHVMNDMRPLAQRYAMNVAETASTFAEMIVADASVKKATSDEERIVLLEDKVQRAVSYFMDIQSRFLFETNFYAERKKGLVSVERLNELMTQAQKDVFEHSLASYHPHFWASKLHFYMTSVPFYNFPYTFGYLFSAGIYARAIQEGMEFEEKYIALLQDTASMTVEELASKHLGVDLTQPEFWQEAVSLAVRDVEEFLELTK
ncbi:M3 family oligoendopeptidase [Caldalkalibacillus mannanilyticus]|uniref:M3 family oligoendopeptidase n=1 Tax=Caldalkalibacillus mannanilyticus TaxID=1418 RepID=UPI000469E860|nr:M3 family oligoendopeptidase [Caldalkalibacillus mannanilyticus]